VALGGGRSSQDKILGLWVPDRRSLSLACPGRLGEMPHDGRNVRPRSRDGIRPSFALTSPSKMRRAQGRPGARCTRGRFAQERCAKARRPQVQAETLRPSLRSGLRLIRALPGEPSRLPPSSARCASIVANLAPRHWGARTTRLRRPRMAPLVSRRRPRPPHPASRFVTTRTPLVSRQDTRTIRLILPSEKRKYFLRQGLTRFRRRRSTGKSMHKPGANSWGSAKP
jgi:hypothetical protein